MTTQLSVSARFVLYLITAGVNRRAGLDRITQLDPKSLRSALHHLIRSGLIVEAGAGQTPRSYSLSGVGSPLALQQIEATPFPAPAPSLTEPGTAALSKTAIALLLVIAKKGRHTRTGLSLAIGRNPDTARQALRTLVAQGLVLATALPDRPTKFYSLSETGIAAARLHIEAQARITPEEIAATEQMLATFREQANQKNHIPA